MTETIQNMVVYQSETGAISLKSDDIVETIWATQKQMAQLFDVEIPTINEHIKAIFSSEELEQDPTIRKFRIVQKEGKRDVSREVAHYNLDMIISVGYRVNSKQATNFRKWATQVLKEHISQGYTVNEEFLKNRQSHIQKAIDTIRLLSEDSALITKGNVLDLIQGFTHTWFSLQRYDTDSLPEKGSITQTPEIDSADLYQDIETLKQTLMTQGEATPLFAQEKNQGSLEGIIGNVMQNVFGEDVYSTLEEKAAHLLYFIIKNHPFNDGNKRTAAFSFIWFLTKSDFPLASYITPNMLTTLTLFIAESEPKYKDRIIGLILELLSSHK